MITNRRTCVPPLPPFRRQGLQQNYSRGLPRNNKEIRKDCFTQPNVVQLMNYIKIRNLQATRQRQLTFTAFLFGDVSNKSNGGNKNKNFGRWQEMQVSAVQASLEYL